MHRGGRPGKERCRRRWELECWWDPVGVGGVDRLHVSVSYGGCGGVSQEGLLSSLKVEVENRLMGPSKT